MLKTSYHQFSTVILMLSGPIILIVFGLAKYTLSEQQELRPLRRIPFKLL